MVAADVGLLDYSYAPAGADPEGAWILRGQLHPVGLRPRPAPPDRCAARRVDRTRSRRSGGSSPRIPKIELSVTSEAGARAIEGLLAFARACLMHAG